MSEKRFNIESKAFEIKRIIYPDSTPISSVKPIEEGGLLVRNVDDLKELVEAPLLEACQVLFIKGIKTVFSSANEKDVESGYVYITIDYNTLSEENKKIALNAGELESVHGSIQSQGVYIKIPITENSTVGEIKEKSLGIARSFSDQSNRKFDIQS